MREWVWGTILTGYFSESELGWWVTQRSLAFRRQVSAYSMGVKPKGERIPGGMLMV